MTDIVAVMFLIGIAALFTVMIFIFKHSMLCVVSGIAWLILGIYNFTRYYSGDPDAGIMVWGFGWLCLALTFVCWTAPLWLLKIKTEDKKEEKVDYYEDIQKRAESIRKLRPRKKIRGIWD